MRRGDVQKNIAPIVYRKKSAKINPQTRAIITTSAIKLSPTFIALIIGKPIITAVYKIPTPIAIIANICNPPL